MVAIDIGHSLKKPGAISARGVKEYIFNRNIAERLLSEIKKKGFVNSFIINAKRDDMPLIERASMAVKKKADILISIHHDSVQPMYLSQWHYKGKLRHYSDRYSGFSLFYSKKNSTPKQSLVLARYIGKEFLKKGFGPSLHHAEKIKGENRKIIDNEKGIYQFDDLIILKKSSIPAILIECGIIVHREEERHLSEPSYQGKIVDAMIQGILSYCQDTNH